MRRLWESSCAFWRQRVWGPRLRTYSETREELGGVPWKRLDSTERWFVATPGDSRPATLDSAAFIIPRTGVLDWLRRLPATAWLTVAGAAVVIALAQVVLSTARAATPAPIVGVPTVGAPTIATPIVAAPIVRTPSIAAPPARAVVRVALRHPARARRR